MVDTPLDQQNVCRIGISKGDDPVGNLGETDQSYGFGGTGKFSTAGRFVDYGERFGVDDTIVCLVDLESKPWGSIEFSKNGKRLGIAKHYDGGPRSLGVIDSPGGKLTWISALFPHVLLKNTVVEMQFSIEDGLVPVEGFKPWACAVADGEAIVGPSFADPTDCEVLMLVGLPASGKTTWAEKWVKDHPEKRYILLGTNLALDQMKVPGLLRKHNYGERFDRLMDQATYIFNTFLSRAPKVPWNYIIDQTNVYKNARKRKLKPFATYHKLAVVAFPRPEELKLRAEKRFKEMGKEVPPDAVNEMLANFVLPKSKDMRGTDEYFDEIIFTELNRDDAQQHLEEMKRALQSSSTENSENHFTPYSRESSIYSDTGMPAYSVLGPRHANSGYSASSPYVGGLPPGGSWTSHPSPAGHAGHPYSAMTNTGHTWYGQPDRVEAFQPYQSNVNMKYTWSGREEAFQPYQANINTRYDRSVHPGIVEPSSCPARDAYLGTHTSLGNPVPREDLIQYDGYMHYPHRRLEATYSYGTPTEYVDYPDSTRSAYQSSYGAPGLSPYRHPNPNPLGTPNPSSYGHSNPTPYGHPNPSPYENADLSQYGPCPANVQCRGSESYGPPRFY